VVSETGSHNQTQGAEPIAHQPAADRSGSRRRLAVTQPSPNPGIVTPSRSSRSAFVRRIAFALSDDKRLGIV
jgi:hypothetical protein